jgi:hypothetical protein
VSSPLSDIEIDKRRQVAATLGLFAMLFIAIGAVAATGATTAIVKGFVVVALILAVLLGLMAWGVLHSIKLDLTDRELDAAIEAAVKASGRSMCDCGHEHDPDELHFVDGEGKHLTGIKCAHDGSGVDCSHSCDTCVLAAMRPSPARTRAQRLGQNEGAAPSRP